MANKYKEWLTILEASEELSLHPQSLNVLCRNYEKGLPRGIFSKFDSKGRRRISIETIEEFQALREAKRPSNRGEQ